MYSVNMKLFLLVYKKRPGNLSYLYWGYVQACTMAAKDSASTMDQPLLVSRLICRQ